MLSKLGKKAQEWGYAPVGEDLEVQDDNEVAPTRPPLLWLLAATCLLLFFGAGLMIQQHEEETRTLVCNDPIVRREWRTLSLEEKKDFTDSFNCLSKLPSRLGFENATRYDDFSQLHQGVGSHSHQSSSFLPWHRFVVDIYEKEMKTYCGFKGHIPYWDWSLDFEDLNNSPIFDPVIGFGGDGDPNGEETVGGGRCVIDGAFAGLNPTFWNDSRQDHCLSRGFRWGLDGEKGDLPGPKFSPTVVNTMLNLDNYLDFVHKIEEWVHNMLHNSIGGDFMTFSAANDPLFLVHHAQLDRIWWRWQLLEPKTRLHEYMGKPVMHSHANATVEDMLSVGGFAKEVHVFEVLNTKGGFLCYTYPEEVELV